MIDLGTGWSTARLILEPVQPGHAVELHALLDDETLHRFTGGHPLDLAAWRDRLELWSRRRSPDGTQAWGNWVLRQIGSGEAVGYVQVTLPAPGRAEVAWVLGRRWQGLGLASEAAASLVARLLADGCTVVAHIHPDHAASQRVAAAAGLMATDRLADGEREWKTGATDVGPLSYGDHQ